MSYDTDARRLARAAAGLCNRCGKQEPKQDCLACEVCIAREYAGVQRRRDAARAMVRPIADACDHLASEARP